MKVLLLLAAMTPVLHAEDPLIKGPGLEIDLISENRSITPGQSLTVGLHIDHLPGFHTYWKSPGMVGMPTSINWSLPEGFTASEIQWPYPENTFMAEYPCHGYERDVTLLVTITPPKVITTKQVTFKAETMWMCCAKGCFPGNQTFELTLPVTAESIPDPTAKNQINKARKQLPATSHEIKATLLSEIDAPVIEIRFFSGKPLPNDDLYFFSDDGQISSDQNQKFIRHPDGSLVLKIARSQFSPEQKESLPGILKMGSKHLTIDAGPKI